MRNGVVQWSPTKAVEEEEDEDFFSIVIASL